MQLGLALPQYDYARTGLRFADDVLSIARTADEAGFASLWLADHLFMSIEKYGGPAGDHFGYEPLTALAAVAGVTARARIGTLVLCAQLRPATLLAKELATLDVLSGGRLDVGVGAGWNKPEYDAAGIAFERPGVRLRQLADTLVTLHDLLGPDPSIPIRPPAVQQPRPPLWVGGRGDRLLEVVARHADGWNTAWAVDRQWYRERVDVLERACDRVGRDPTTVLRSIGLYSLVGTDDRDLRRRFERLAGSLPPGVLDGMDLEQWKSGRLVGTVEEVRDRLGSWSDLGVSTVIAGPGALPFSVIDPDDLHLLASAIP